MVCQRCIQAVESAAKEQNLTIKTIQLGEVEVENPSTEQIQKFKSSITALGFEVIQDKQSKTIESIKKILRRQVYENLYENQNLSQFLSQELHQDYSALSKLFSEVEGQTIEKYHIALKIERAKELLLYNELSLSQIADELQYSNAAYLSNQFKKHTGLTPSFFREIKQNKRNNLDSL